MWRAPAARSGPGDPVTRGEMAELLVRALGLKGAAERLNDTSSTYSHVHGGTPFIDLPEGKAGYITIAYRIGMTNGTSNTTFSPGQHRHPVPGGGHAGSDL